MFRPALGKVDMLAFALACWLCGLLTGLANGAAAGETAASEPRPRDVRVLVAADVERVRLRADGTVSFRSDEGMSLDAPATGRWIIASAEAFRRVRIDDDAWPASEVTVGPKPPGVVEMSVHDGEAWRGERRFPGSLRLIARKNNRLDVINTVEVEQYVASVVANEVWPTFDKEAYRAQAIAARTFVLYQMSRRNLAPFDLSATQGAQVYQGIRTDGPGRRAIEAAQDTQGVVLTYVSDGREQLFCAYYSAACGGRSQSAAIFGPEDDIEPLAGGVPCRYCEIAPGQTYRWGPVRFTKRELRSRLVSAYPDMASLGALRAVAVTERTPSGRPVRLRTTWSNGESRDTLAERFRLAIGGHEIRSTDFQLRSSDRYVTFENGRGFGHGLGLCQWGAQGQALKGNKAGSILRYYYPGAKITRAY